MQDPQKSSHVKTESRPQVNIPKRTRRASSAVGYHGGVRCSQHGDRGPCADVSDARDAPTNSKRLPQGLAENWRGGRMLAVDVDAFHSTFDSCYLWEITGSVFDCATFREIFSFPFLSLEYIIFSRACFC